MLDTPTKDIEPAPGWRFPRFLRFGDDGETAQPKGKKPPKEPEERKHHFAVWYVFAAFLGVMLIQYVWLAFSQVQTIPYSQFEHLLDENKISEVLVGPDSIQGTLKQPLPDGRKLFYTVRVDPALADKLKAHDVTITGAPSSNFSRRSCPGRCPSSSST
jgi:cell division protease FtsH